jgi:hypothetical protein
MALLTHTHIFMRATGTAASESLEQFKQQLEILNADLRAELDAST